MSCRGITLRVLLFGVMITPVCQASPELPVEALAPLPQPVSNNAVTLLADDSSLHIYTFLGLGPAKNREDILRAAWMWDSTAGKWSVLPDVPVKAGRLAATAVTVAGSVYLFGGYTVAADGSELSTAEVFRMNARGMLEEISKMPIAVDDTVALVYRDRYVYLVSGWHDVGNVNLVQVYDSVENSWQQAEPWPGDPVFGHAGGISGDTMLICDGVRVIYPAEPGPRQFIPSSQCWLGVVNNSDLRRIRWRQLEPHPGKPRYRMAASAAAGRIVFAGGTDNPYNYDGIGYDGVASNPIADVFSFDIKTAGWRCHGQATIASMDHRALLAHGGWFYIVGGMLADQEVSDKLLRFRLPEKGNLPCQG